MNRLLRAADSRLLAVPRASGDEPTLRTAGCRGWYLFPAPAGMNRTVFVKVFSLLGCSPRQRG